MSNVLQLRSYWDIVTEIDLRPLANQAQEEARLAIVCASRERSSYLAEQFRRDPARPDMTSDTPVNLLDLSTGDQAASADLIILLLDGYQDDFETEKNLARLWANTGKRVLVFVELPHKPASPQEVLPALPWRPRYVLYGPIDDPAFLHQKLVPLVIRMMPDHLLSLGRNFPLFRVPVANYLINDTSQSNAAYSLATGLAEIVPILNIPLVITDMIILTKNQAFLIYKLGLVFGFTTDWRNYAGEFGGVIGAGFFWRQLARSLVGLIPIIGIIPKVAISYAGTKVVGTAILHWYLTGRHISTNQLKATYQQALGHGKNLARRLLPGARTAKPDQLEQPAKTQRFRRLLPGAKTAKTNGPGQPTKARSTRRAKPVCPVCNRKNHKEALYCQYCGQPLEMAVANKPGDNPSPAP